VQRIPGYGKPVEPVFADWMNKVAPWARFIHPYPLSEKYFLVSAKMPTNAEGTAYQARFGIFLVDVFDNVVPIRREADASLFEPIPLKPRPTPPVIPDQVDLSRTDALVYLQDVYAGQGLAGVPRGTVKKLRLFTYHFSYRGTGGQWDRVGMDGPWEPKRVLGTVPVEDGNEKGTSLIIFCVAWPARTAERKIEPQTCGRLPYPRFGSERTPALHTSSYAFKLFVVQSTVDPRQPVPRRLDRPETQRQFPLALTGRLRPSPKPAPLPLLGALH
jgi:hypothetical protein